MQREINKLKETVLYSPPAFHIWHDKPQTGGFSKIDFEEFDQIITRFLPDLQVDEKPPVMIETGAGLSTLWFLANGFNVVSFSMPDVLQRMQDFLMGEYDEASNWSFFAGESERNLIPKLAQHDSDFCDVALIDGNHAAPSVFADFVALNLCLKRGGLLIVDDLKLPGPSLLKQFLRQSPSNWTSAFQSSSGKWECYLKESDIAIAIGNGQDLKFKFPEHNSRIIRGLQRRIRRIFR